MSKAKKEWEYKYNYTGKNVWFRYKNKNTVVCQKKNNTIISHASDFHKRLKFVYLFLK